MGNQSPSQDLPPREPSEVLAATPQAHVGRIHAIDAARGIAMFFVCLAHFGDGYFERLDRWTDPQHMVISRIAMMASPTFMLISGVMLGFLLSDRPASSTARTRERFVDRGLFLLTIGHVLITLAHIPMVGVSKLLYLFPITDAIGFSLLLGPIVMSSLSVRSRLLTGAGLIVSTWVTLSVWHPAVGSPLQLAKLFLFGDLELGKVIYGFPLLPWFGLYLVGSALGREISQMHKEGRVERIERLLGLSGFFSVTSAISLSAVYLLLKRRVLLADANLSGAFLRGLSPLQKSPPSLVYFAFYGGVGLFLLAALVRIERMDLGKRLISTFALVGRNSLIAFILQHYIYFAWVVLVPPPPLPWPLYFFITVLLLFWSLRAWDARGLSAWLTVGYRRSAN